MKLIECQRCLLTSNIAKIGEIQCEYCDMHDELDNKYDNFDKILEIIKKQKCKYNCIIGISGGKDSSTLLYSAVKKWNLNPLVIHFNNHWNTEIAKENMMNLIQKLNVDFIEYYVNKEEYDNLNKAFLKAGVPDADIPNDIAMVKLIYETAEKYNIKYILSGNCYKTEGSTPREWTYMDAKYIESIYETYYNKKLVNFPLFTFSDQIHYAEIGIVQIRPFYYKSVDRNLLDEEMTEFINWKTYGWKHGENTYTDFVGSYLLPRKFNIDKRIVYLSARIRSGYLNKNDARNMLNVESCFDLNLLGDEYIDLIDSPIQDRSVFKKYDFKKYKWIVYYLYLLGVVPYTFYIKYTDKVDMEYHKIDELNKNDKEIILKNILKYNCDDDIEFKKIIDKLCYQLKQQINNI